MQQTHYFTNNEEPLLNQEFGSGGLKMVGGRVEKN